MTHRNSFMGNFIGSVNGTGYIVSHGNIVTIDGKRVTASYGSSSVTGKTLKLVALDENGKELESFNLPTGTEINLTVHVEPGTPINSIDTNVGSVSVHGAASITTLESTNGSITVDGAEKVGSIKTINGDVEVKATTVGDIKTVNGSIKRR